MLNDVKLALRLSSDAFDTEITMLIDACKLDLQLAGVGVVDETNALIKNAIIFYCKANFGENENADKWQRAYDNIKNAIALTSLFDMEE
jgi:hypothetical protein